MAEELKCFTQPVLIAETDVKFHLNPLAISLYFAVIALREREIPGQIEVVAEIGGVLEIEAEEDLTLEKDKCILLLAMDVVIGVKFLSVLLVGNLSTAVTVLLTAKVRIPGQKALVSLTSIMSR